MFHRCVICGHTVVIRGGDRWPDACPDCGASPFGARSVDFAGDVDHSASRRLDVLERDAPHLIAPIEPRDV